MPKPIQTDSQSSVIQGLGSAVVDQCAVSVVTDIWVPIVRPTAPPPCPVAALPPCAGRQRGAWMRRKIEYCFRAGAISTAKKESYVDNIEFGSRIIPSDLAIEEFMTRRQVSRRVRSRARRFLAR